MKYTFEELFTSYLLFLKNVRNLSPKSIEAYETDIRQLRNFMIEENLDDFINLTASEIEVFFDKKLSHYNPRTIKRKIAALKVFFKYVTRKIVQFENPFLSLEFKIKIPKSFPNYLTELEVQELLKSIYIQLPKIDESTKFNKKQLFTLRDLCIIEVLFNTGLRVSELVKIKPIDLDLENGRILIEGKGSKERVVYVTNLDVITLIRCYQSLFAISINTENRIFLNNRCKKISDQTVRHIVKRYTSVFDKEKITPHTFRHTCASLLLSSGANLRMIQTLLGHSSITTTELYTHINNSRLKDDLKKYHPRNTMLVL